MKQSTKEQNPGLNSAAAALPTDGPEDVCPWESGALGRDARFARAVPDDGSVDKALGLVKVGTRVTLRLERKLKRTHGEIGLSFPAYVRQALVEKMRRDRARLGQAWGQRRAGASRAPESPPRG